MFLICYSTEADQAATIMLLKMLISMIFHVSTEVAFCILLQINYISTWSAHGTHRQRHPEEEDPLIQFKRDLMATLDVNDGSCNVAVVWPIFMLLAKTKH